MLREIQALKSSLYYELTSPIYQEKADQTVYLDFIDYSNMDYYTSVKRKKSAYIPLLLYNYEGELFHLLPNTHHPETGLALVGLPFLQNSLRE
jgi:hypothetical protein